MIELVVIETKAEGNMALEEVLTQEWLWAAIGAMVTVAGTAGGVISWMIAAWIRRRDKPEPEWVFQVTKSQARNVGGIVPEADAIQIRGLILNAGDGTVFGVQLRGSECEAAIDHKSTGGNQIVGVIRPGETIDFSCSMALIQWETAAMTLEWTEAPTRLKRGNSKTIEAKKILPKLYISQY